MIRQVPRVERQRRAQELVASDDRLNDGVGYFREILSPRMEQFETIFTAPGPLEGVSILLGGLTEPIIEHGYWGSMRDRLPLSQTDTMDPVGELTLKQGTPAKGGPCDCDRSPEFDPHPVRRRLEPNRR